MKNAITTLAPRAPDSYEPWRDAAWQKLWLSLIVKPWASLAICPAAGGASPDFAVNIAVALARIGMMHRNVPVVVADGTRLQLSDVVDFASEVKAYSSRGEQVLVAVAPLAESPVALTLMQASDRVLLCALLERMSSAEAMQTVDKVGKERFVGTAVFRPDLLPLT
jgi:hypothetical protein